MRDHVVCIRAAPNLCRRVCRWEGTISLCCQNRRWEEGYNEPAGFCFVRRAQRARVIGESFPGGLVAVGLGRTRVVLIGDGPEDAGIAALRIVLY